MDYLVDYPVNAISALTFFKSCQRSNTSVLLQNCGLFGIF